LSFTKDDLRHFYLNSLQFKSFVLGLLSSMLETHPVLLNEEHVLMVLLEDQL